MIFRCPVCKGPIAMWVVREAFTCHHCRWALSSNVNAAIGRGVWLGCAAALLFMGGLWLGLGSLPKALDVWMWSGGGLGFIMGSVYVSRALRLVPLRAPRKLAQQDAIDPQSLKA